MNLKNILYMNINNSNVYVEAISYHFQIFQKQKPKNNQQKNEETLIGSTLNNDDYHAF